MINKTFGCTRLIYNYFLDLKQKEYELNKTYKSTYDCIREYTCPKCINAAENIMFEGLKKYMKEQGLKAI